MKRNPKKKKNTCGLTLTQDSKFYSYNGILVIEVLDIVGSLRNTPVTRVTKAMLAIRLELPRSINLNATSIVNSLPNLFSAITKQR